MTRYEYRALYERVSISMTADQFGKWVFEKLNEWGAQGWFITQYQTPMTTQGGRQALTGELMATGCREIPGVGDAEMGGMHIGGDAIEPHEDLYT